MGSGVVEAGGKTVIGLHLKQSGMRWTVDHAKCHHRPALLSNPRPLGGILGATLRRLTCRPFLTCEFGARPGQFGQFFHLHTVLLFAMIKRFREYSFLLLRYHCERSQSGRG